MAKRTFSEHHLASWDGTRLFYRAWLPSEPAKKALLLFHRGHEHSGRLQELVDKLGLDDFAVFAWDARGNGRSEGPRDYAENFACYLKDADLFARHVSREYGIPLQNMAVLGHSVGAAVVAAWVHDFAPRLRAVVLATPAFRIRLYFPFAVPLLRLALRLGLMKKVPSYVKARVLTHDPDHIRQYNQDTLITHSISTNILLDLYDTSTRILEDASAIQTPVLLLTVGSDWVVDIKAQRRFFERLGSPTKVMEFYPRFYHALFHEQERDRPIERTRRFITGMFEQPYLHTPLTAADKAGTTREEYDSLLRPLPLLSAKAMYYRTLKFLLKTVGRLSAGIRLGWESGFNSGRTLEYVYKNEPTGTTFLGRSLDRIYLNGIGWRGIRVRRIILERLIKKRIQECIRGNGGVHLVDIAAGAGRYVLQALKDIDPKSVSAELRDFEPKNLVEGQKTAESLGVRNVRFVQGDAFDRTSLAALAPRPDIALVSGLYELFPQNVKVLNSLKGLADAVRPGGYLIYTNQPWHPQLELIARALCDWDGEPWVMRRRTQAEMDDLVREAGFEKIEMEMDPWGIFTVSVAQRARK